VNVRAYALIDEIYRTPLDTGAWTDVLLGLCDVVGAYTGSISHRNGRDATLTHTLNLGDGAKTAYDQFWGARDPLIDHVNVLPPGFVTTTRTVYPDIERTEFYNEYAKPRDRFDWLIVNTYKAGSERTQILLARGPGDRPFGRDQCSVARQLQPHLARATAIARELQRERTAPALGNAAFEQAPHALLVMQGAELRTANAAARALLASRDGLCVRRRRLEPTSDRAAPLRAALAAACTVDIDIRAAADIVVGGGAPRQPPALQFLPLERQLVDEPPGIRCCLVVVRDPDRCDPLSDQYLRNAFSLTTTEIEIARLLVSGARVRTIAGNLGVRESTVRWHIRNLLQKTNTTCQADLVRALQLR
jgi:DNA-binding CsgD family transcriptional regulator